MSKREGLLKREECSEGRSEQNVRLKNSKIQSVRDSSVHKTQEDKPCWRRSTAFWFEAKAHTYCSLRYEMREEMAKR